MIYNSKKQIEEAIKKQIISVDSQAIKAMLRIYEYQTFDEQVISDTTNANGVGFTVGDAYILTSFCKQYQSKGFLSPKQIDIVKKKIGKYAHQLMNQAVNNGLYVKKDGVWVVAR